MHPPKTADLYDHFASELQVAESMFGDLGGHPAFFGPITTLKVYEDNALVRSRLEEPGAGRVLVVDGAGSTRTALLGDQLGAIAAGNGWAGVVINGCVRDVEELSELDLGIRALGTTPRKSDKRGTGTADVPVTFAGVTFTPGHWLYADADGIVVAPRELPPLKG